MKLPANLPLYGDHNFTGDCASEALEQVTFFNLLRQKYPDTYGRIGIHIRNEGKRTHSQAAREKAEGMVKGASDIIIPGSPAFICEMKRKNYRMSRLADDQVEYLLACQKAGAFVCVALGYEAAWEAFQDWLTTTTTTELF